MNTNTNFKDISQGGSRNVQKIIHNHAPADRFTEFLCKAMDGMQKTIRTLMSEKRRLNKELSDTKARLHGLELEMERRKLPLLDVSGRGLPIIKEK